MERGVLSSPGHYQGEGAAPHKFPEAATSHGSKWHGWRAKDYRDQLNRTSDYRSDGA